MKSQWDLMLQCGRFGESECESEYLDSKVKTVSADSIDEKNALHYNASSS